MKEDVYPLPEGEVTFVWPDRLSKESFEDIEAWAKLVLRKISRHVVDESEDQKNSGGVFE